MTKTDVLAIGVVGIIALALVPFLYPRLETGQIWHNVIGVDVSAHQGDIDWPSLADSGVAFAYIKATQGDDFRDGYFRRNWYGARAAGVPRGAYHYFTRCRPGADQAANFIRTVPRESGVLPPAVDAEHMGRCPRGRSVADVGGELLLFMDLIEARYGKRPVVYVTAAFNRVYLDRSFDNESFWVPSLFRPPSIRRNRWLFWQFHHYGRRPGIRGPVDLNAFRGTAEDLVAMLR